MIDPDVNNYFKLAGGTPLILCFNDRSPNSTRGQLNLARIMARRYDVDVVVWKHWPGRPEDVALIGEVTKRPRALPSPVEPNGGSDDYPTPDEEEDEQSEGSEGREAAGLGSDTLTVEPGV